MKKIIYLILVSLLTAFVSFAQDKALRGDEAINQLKQTGQYDSLMEAFKAARQENGQTDELPLEDAIGQSAKLTAAGGAADDQFGTSVAISGDTAIVGAPLDDVGANIEQGSAYIFVRSGTSWSQQAQLTAADGVPGDFFGWSVAISGDTAIVGAYFDEVGANTAQGSAYIFFRSGTSWSQQAQLTASDGAVVDQFGWSVGISGETAIIGAYVDDIGANTNQGSAYIFVRSGTMWSQQQKLTATGGAASDQFGYSVGINGETAIIGANFDDVGANSNRGSAYIFVRAGTSWSQQAQLIASDGTTSDRFGISVAISGETVIVGAYFDDTGSNNNQGSAYVFVRAGTMWSQQQKLTASDGAAQDQFGTSVGISGNAAIVGADEDNVGANGKQGSAYVYVRVGTSWSQQLQITASDGAANDFFGSSVAVSDDYFIVGAQFDDVGANTDQGSAYINRFLGTTWTQEAQKVASDGGTEDQFGNSVAISGDTAIVGAIGDDITGANQGSAYIFVRSGTSWSQQQKLTASDAGTNDEFGRSVAISGDTVIVGAHLDTFGANTAQGSAYVFVRAGTMWSQQQKLTASDGAANDFFGRSVAISGETAIIGASLDNFGATIDQGSAYIFVRSGTSWSQQQNLIASDGTTSDNFGDSVGISGETVIVGAYFDDTGSNNNQGSAYVFVRAGTMWSQQQKLTASDGAAQDQFGTSVAISGDTAIVGAYVDDVGANIEQGSAYIFVRSGTSWSQQAQLTASDGAANDNFGDSVGISGETAIVGASGDDFIGGSNRGSAYIFVRSGASWTQQQKLAATGGAAFDNFGASVGISGDKIIVGAPFSDVSASVPLAPQATNQGAVFMFINQPLAPTASGVTVGGYVLTQLGHAPRRAFVTLSDIEGQTQTTTVNRWGHYQFTDVAPGRTYFITVEAKGYSFTPPTAVVTPAFEVQDMNFQAFPLPRAAGKPAG